MSTSMRRRGHRGRIDELDAARGACLVSMVFGHIASGTLVSTIIHLPLWANGAMGFVMVSGMVLAIVRKPRVERGGQAWFVTTASWKRSRDLWLIVVSLALVTLAAREVVGRKSTIPHISDLGSTASVIVDVLLLQTTIQFIDVLTVYVFLLLIAPLLLHLLRRRHGAAVGLLIALAFYVVDWFAPIEFLRTYNYTMAEGGGAVPELVMVPARWLMLFVIGMTLGWHWDRTIHVIGRTSVRFALFASMVAFTFLARFHEATDQPPIPDRWIDRATLGPISLVFGVVAVLALILVLERNPAPQPSRLEWAIDRVKQLLGEIGRHSLDTFLIHIFVLVTANLLLGLPFATPIALMLSVLSLIVALYWSRAQERRASRKRSDVQQAMG